MAAVPLIFVILSPPRPPAEDEPRQASSLIFVTEVYVFSFISFFMEVFVPLHYSVFYLTLKGLKSVSSNINLPIYSVLKPSKFTLLVSPMTVMFTNCNVKF